MPSDRVRALTFISAAISGLAISTISAGAQTPYDGLWSVTIVTKAGSCEPTASSIVTVSDGKVSGAGDAITCSVGREGAVRVSIRGAYANGQLSGNAGSGKWNSASTGVPCSGRWEASRQ